MAKILFELPDKDWEEIKKFKSLASCHLPDLLICISRGTEVTATSQITGQSMTKGNTK